MKKALILLPLLFLGGGCSAIASANDTKPAVMHSSYFKSETKQKPIVYWPVTLKDSWNEMDHNITMNDFGFILTPELDEDSLRQLASELASQIDKAMVNPKLKENGEVIAGQPRVILAEEELIETLRNLEVGTSELELPIYVTEPLSAEEIRGIDQKIVASYKSYFNPSVAGRSQNVFLSSEAITGVVIGPGDSFSFNHTVGQRTRERGYQEAKEIVDKEFVMGIGGGICQTSSTLFNAVDQAGLEMIERYTHSREVGYVPAGRDATVSWGGPDFRFRNPFSYPVLIRSSVDKQRGEIQVTVHKH
ncbi:VanW family protein [Halalkalibacter akibai]|uniref:Vancomycin B-type resistance protein VanW n=1 Tax=Halalkalibacter akibai (strain ATCC 43226 / DSM 21942 / CIP 109018 / JCM 9157 / 1139) TaxID=1236973 RepID=W4QW63_HALA3|nr:VanW family protein [Halalkalibacter akibai]GAE35878.1 vancomycin B-type resistance protein VanW [Halalkalibacter akibai JCM 9157]